jgi:hypothetical protein
MSNVFPRAHSINRHHAFSRVPRAVSTARLPWGRWRFEQRVVSRKGIRPLEHGSTLKKHAVLVHRGMCVKKVAATLGNQPETFDGSIFSRTGDLSNLKRIVSFRCTS